MERIKNDTSSNKPLSKSFSIYKLESYADQRNRFWKRRRMPSHFKPLQWLKTLKLTHTTTNSSCYQQQNSNINAKVVPVHAMKVQGGRRGKAPLTLDPGVNTKLCGQFHAPDGLHAWKSRRTHWIWGWADLRASLYVFKDRKHLLSLPGFEQRSVEPVAYRMGYPGYEQSVKNSKHSVRCYIVADVSWTSPPKDSKDTWAFTIRDKKKFSFN
jgi:hypothetical protein